MYAECGQGHIQINKDLLHSLWGLYTEATDSFHILAQYKRSWLALSCHKPHMHPLASGKAWLAAKTKKRRRLQSCVQTMPFVNAIEGILVAYQVVVKMQWISEWFLLQIIYYHLYMVKNWIEVTSQWAIQMQVAYIMIFEPKCFVCTNLQFSNRVEKKPSFYC